MHPTEPADSGQDPSEKVDLDRLLLAIGLGLELRRQGDPPVKVSVDGEPVAMFLFPEEEIVELVEEIEQARAEARRLLAEVARLRAERDRLIDGHISASGPVARHVRYTVFPDSIAERKFDTREQARAHVRRMLGLEVES